MTLHVVAASPTAGAWHTIRSSTGWTPWAPLPPFPVPVTRIDSAFVNGELHVCAATSTTPTVLLHTFRDAAGAWQPFWGDVGNAAGLPSSQFEFQYVGLAGDGTTLHVFTTVRPRGGGGGLQPAFVWPIYHATRSTGSAAAWTSSFSEINPGQFPGTTTVFTETTSANVAGSIHVCALGFYGNELWHTIELSPPPTESWQPYNDVKLVHTNSPVKIGTVSVTGVGSNLHVLAVSGGEVFHTIRMSSPPSWQNPEGSGISQWGNVTAVVSGVPPGSANFIDCAASDGNLHLCCITKTGGLFHTIRTSAPSPVWQNPEGSSNATWGDVSALVGALGPNPAPFGLVTATGS
jgi:hypothetical protein